MSVKNNLDQRYNRHVISLHWISALLILSLLPTGKIMRGMESTDVKMALYQYHVAVGLSVAVLTLIRVYLFFTKERPTPIDAGWVWHNRLIYYTQRAFYVLLVVLSISGVATVVDAGLVDVILTGDLANLPKMVESEVFEAHEISANIMIALLVGHVGGVALHYYRFKENMLKRIFYR